MHTKEMDHIQNSLSFLGEEAEEVAELLHLAQPEGGIRYMAVARQFPEPEELILAAWHWRLLIPSHAPSKSLAWENVMLSFAPQALYKIPPAVREAVDLAAQTGVWQPHQAIIDSCPSLRGQAFKSVAEFLREIRFQERELRISATALGRIMKRLRLRSSLDQLVLEFKACGMLSPYLTSTLGSFTGKSPMYELNPSLLRGEA